MPHLGTSGFADPPLANVIVRYIYIYIYIYMCIYMYIYIYIYMCICWDKHVNTLAGVSSKHKQTSCWNETNSLSHHLLSLQKAMFQLHYPNDLIHIGQFSKLIDFLHTVYSVYMLHTCCIHVAFCGNQCSFLASGSSEPSNSMALSEDLRLTVGWLCLLRLSARFLSNSHPEGNSDF